MHFLGISVDESFVEIGLLSKNKLVDSQRSFLPRENLRSALRKFLEKHRSTPIDRAYVSLRFLEKILDYRLGGSVAQLVTEGFENWLQIRSSKPEAQSLSNPDLIFAVPERVSATGEIIKAIDEENLAQIEAKLKLMEVKRVCIHFLHAAAQPQNQSAARDFFVARGFDVFVPPASENPDEISRWRANTLNASMSGTFLEIQDEVAAACEGQVGPENIFYLSSEKKTFQKENHRRLGSLFSTRSAIVHTQGSDADLLYLGVEKFSWLRKSETPLWQSAWGEVELSHPLCVDLEIQPTSAIALNEFSELDFSEKIEGFEPGPIFMGRGQRPTFLDLYSEDENLKSLEGICDRIPATAGAKIKNTLTALAKTATARGGVEASALASKLRDLALDRISMEVNLCSEKIKIVGPLAPLLGPALLSRNPNWQLEKNPFVDSLSVAKAGADWAEKT